MRTLVTHPRLLAPALLAVCAAGALSAAPAPGPERFAAVHRLLSERCIQCHGPAQKQGGLRLDLRADALRGGDSGPALRPGHGAESLLIRYVRGADPKKVMPPTGPRLAPDQVALLKDWIDQGAPWPGEPARSGSGSASHWAFVAPKLPTVPAVKLRSWVKTPVDAFILARLEKEGVRPSPPADRATLIRRLSLDLTGLLPSPKEVDAFLADRDPNAYERVVDRLLASPHFGERWGRHWLDLARYADSDGYEKDLPRTYAYLYRDWVIQAFNRDMPFDRFTVEQLAGDLLPGATLEQKIATGFHRNTLKNREGGADQEEDRNKIAVDRVNTTGTAWLGLTVACAECHSHKYDPISQREYYGLFAFFNSVQDVDLPAARPEEQQAYERAKAEHARREAELKQALRDFEAGAALERQARWEQTADRGRVPPTVAEIMALPAADRTPGQSKALRDYYKTLDPVWVKLEAGVSEHAKKAPAPPAKRAQTLAENPKPPATRIHLRGDFLRKGDPVDPHTPSVLPALQVSDKQPNRLDLARWLVDPRHPLTARVAVNRVWQHLFGQGLVRTSNDWGTRGERPSHPELLDYLASVFAASPTDGEKGGRSEGEKGSPAPSVSPSLVPSVSPSLNPPVPRLAWSHKRLIKLIVMSAVYQQASANRPDLREKDPRNVLLARQSRFRPEAEIVRDLYLGAAGLLNPEVGGPSIRPPLPADIAALGYADSVKWPESRGAERYKRGMYVFFQRTVPYPMLATFDAPDSNVTCTRRERSNTPLQALTLLNDPVFFEAAQALARRVLKEKPGAAAERVRHAFRTCLSREPSTTEARRLEQLHREMLELCRKNAAEAKKLAGPASLPEGVEAEEVAAWVVVARTILNLDEFITRE